MKYIKIYEDFDLDKFMQDPEAEFQKNEDNPEIEPGDYVTSYRGPGQVIDMDDNFTETFVLFISNTLAIPILDRIIPGKIFIESFKLIFTL